VETKIIGSKHRILISGVVTVADAADAPDADAVADDADADE